MKRPLNKKSKTKKQQYQKPTLKRLGNLRQITSFS